jgi:hypothetical protein
MEIQVEIPLHRRLSAVTLVDDRATGHVRDGPRHRPHRNGTSEVDPSASGVNNLGLIVNGPEAVAAAQILVWPAGFLSSVFVAPKTMPGWMDAIAEWNPPSATTSAARELFLETR